ncbi:MAG: DUF45 domain-containing protein, partial [Bacteroidales bacterium]|nr:DUF45 domain-containing protein [Bacteroidales bacterium]
MLEHPVIITRRRTSRITIRINKDGLVRVSAPRFMPIATIKAFVRSHQDWIEKNLEKARIRNGHQQEFYSGLDISTPATRKKAVEQLQQIVAPLIKRHAAEMGVAPS